MTNQVLVSGGSGYIAGFLIRQLVVQGWMVHTTVRSLDNSRVKFFAADLNADAGWAEVMQGCSHVAHLASILPASVPKNADELIRPARDGALLALRAAKAADVKRFVMTSSVAAIDYGWGRCVHNFTEADWNDLSKPGQMPYVQSKTVAERRARLDGGRGRWHGVLQHLPFGGAGAGVEPGLFVVGRDREEVARRIDGRRRTPFMARYSPSPHQRK